jgi:hypothetical protein
MSFNPAAYFLGFGIFLAFVILVYAICVAPRRHRGRRRAQPKRTKFDNFGLRVREGPVTLHDAFGMDPGAPMDGPPSRAKPKPVPRTNIVPVTGAGRPEEKV